MPRIVGHPRYPNPPGLPAPVLAARATMCTLPGHESCPDDVNLRDPGLFDGAGLLDSGQVTDSYLLGLAVAHAGRLVTFDRRLVADAGRGGREPLLVPEG